MSESFSLSWQAVRHVLDHPALRNRVDVFLDDQHQVIDLDVRNEPWSSGERMLIDVALSLTSSQATISLLDVFTTLDRHNARRVYEAIEMIRLDVGCPSIL